jgi:hypothetical protein
MFVPRYRINSQRVKSISAYIPTPDNHLEMIETYFVFDNTGREFKRHIVPWHSATLVPL